MFDVYKNLFSTWVELWTWITCLGWYQNQADEPVSLPREKLRCEVGVGIEASEMQQGPQCEEGLLSGPISFGIKTNELEDRLICSHFCFPLVVVERSVVWRELWYQASWGLHAGQAPGQQPPDTGRGPQILRFVSLLIMGESIKLCL